jgi:YjbE family integral membrane protein
MLDIPTDLLSDLAAIILLDLVLAGDNAIVIAMAASRLPKLQQKKAVFWGAFGAVAIRFALTAVVVFLFRLPGVMLAGGLLLLPIAWNLLQPQDEDNPDIRAGNTFWGALRTIIIADALMGMDNVLAIAGASGGHLGLVITGLFISVPLVVWGSTLIIRLIERYPFIMYIGAAAIAITAGRMITHDGLLHPLLEGHAWIRYGFDALLVAVICGFGWWKRHNAANKPRPIPDA